VGAYNQSTNRYSSSTFTYDTNGRLTYDTFDNLGWDVNGNLLSQSGTTLVYDAFDRPVMAGNMQYLYMPDGSLVGKENSSGSTVTMFVPLPMGRVVFNPSPDHYDPYDWQGSNRVASTAYTRTVYSDTSYDAFGIPYWSSGATNNQYAGLTSDISSGTEQASTTRRYHPTQGRWLVPDSIIPDIYSPQSFNAYHYARNQPTDVTDPGGQDDISDWIGTFINLLTAIGNSGPLGTNGAESACDGDACVTAFNTTWDPRGTGPSPFGFPPITTTINEQPIMVPHIIMGFPMSTPMLIYRPNYPSRMSAEELADVQRAQTAKDIMGLGLAFAGGVAGALDGPGVLVTDFTSAGPGGPIATEVGASQISANGIQQIEIHLSRPDLNSLSEPANQAMITRLQAGYRTTQDVNFGSA